MCKHSAKTMDILNVGAGFQDPGQAVESGSEGPMFLADAISSEQ